jgi:hypothetical protein
MDAKFLMNFEGKKNAIKICEIFRCLLNIKILDLCMVWRFGVYLRIWIQISILKQNLIRFPILYFLYPNKYISVIFFAKFITSYLRKFTLFSAN